MSLAQYLVGAAFFAAMLGLTGLAAVAWVRTAPELRGVPRVVATGVVWLAGILFAHLVPGVLGLLTRGAVSAAAVLWLGAALLLARRVQPGREGIGLYLSTRPSGVRSTWFAAVALLAAAGMLVLVGLDDAGTAPSHPDVMSFHLPNVARWIQHRSLWPVDDFIPDRAPGNYPGTGDMFALAAILPWRSDFLFRLVNFPLLALLGFAIYALAREVRAPAATAVLVASAFVVIPSVAYVGYVGLADTSMLATFAAGSYFLLRSLRSDARSDLVLGALALGISLGTRWYSIPAVGAVALGWLVGARLGGRPGSRLAGQAAVLGAVVLSAGGFWLLRNWVQSGNPVFPVKVAPLGVTIFDAPRDDYRELQGFKLLDYAFQPSIWRSYFWPSFLRASGWGTVLLWIALAGAGLVSVLGAGPRPRLPRGDDARILGLVAVAALIGIAYVLTPYTAVGPAKDMPSFASVNVRYVLPALVLGAATLGWIAARAGPWRQTVDLVALLVVLDGARRFIDLREAAITDGIHAGAVAWTLVFVTAGVALVFTWQRAPRAVAVGAALLALVAVVAVGRRHERAYNTDRYAVVNAVFTRFDTRMAGSRRIGLVGEGWGNYPFFGPRLRNRVTFVGPRRRGMLRNYFRRAEFDRAVARGRFDVIAFEQLGSVHPRLPLLQERWLRLAGWHAVATATQPFGFNRRLTLYLPPARAG